MAKQIKVIKCPQCGSTSKIEVKPDHYRCKKCGTEYFLDTDDITIIHKTEYAAQHPIKPVNTRKALLLILGFFGAILLLSIVLPLLFSKSSTKDNSFKNSEKWDYSTENSAFTSTNGTDIYLVVGKRYKERLAYDNQDKHYYAGFYEMATGKQLKIQKLDQTAESSEDIHFKEFDNGDFYFTVNKIKIYKVDKQGYAVSEMNETFCNNQPELQSGIAKVEFVYHDYGDGFHITTNEGKERYYYPIINRLYTQNQLSQARENFAQLPANALTQVAFNLTRKRAIDNAEERIKLVKYHYKYALGYPRWEADFPINMKIEHYFRERYRVVDYQDFTPERPYFDAKVLDYDDQRLLISFRATASENAPQSVQMMDVNTAKILWTYPLGDMNLHYYGGKLLKNGCLLSGGRYDLYLDNSGKLIRKFDD